MALEVLASPRAGQRLATLTRRQRQTLDQFLDMLAAQGCEALAYRLAGDPPIDQLCVKHRDGDLRVIVAFETKDRAWILLVGEHNDSDASANIDDELYDLLGVEPPESKRTKPPCCDETDHLPPILDTILDDIIDRAKRVRRTRRNR